MSSVGDVGDPPEQNRELGVDVTESNMGRGTKWERSVVWEYFSKKFITGSNKIYNQVVRNYCNFELKCSLSNATSTCHNHAKRCKLNPFREIDATHSQFSFGKNDNEHDKLQVLKFNQDVSEAALARMIITDEMPFVTVERDGFKGFVRSLQPKFSIMSRVSVAKDCFHIYASEMSKLKEFMKNNVQSVCLTTDLWTSIQNQSYLCLSAHFIDTQWNLHKRIINFCVIGDHTGDSIGKLIELCLKNWCIERVCAITVDNASVDDVGISYLKRDLVARYDPVLDGEYLHVECCAHILNLIVQDSLKQCDSTVKRIRASIKYIRSSLKRAEQFNRCAMNENMLAATSGTSLPLDDPTKWNSTYIMLSTALNFQKVFNMMVIEDMFEDLNGGPPTTEDWVQAEVLVKFLAIFYDCTKKLSGISDVTSSQYFEEVCIIKLLIKEWGKNGDPSLKLMSYSMMDKFEKYWESFDKMNMMLMVAAVLDPRVKMAKVKFWIDKLKHYGEDYYGLLEATQHALSSLFTFYSSAVESSSSVGRAEDELEIDIHDNDDHVDVVAKNLDLEFEKHLESIYKDDGRTELERYLGVRAVKNNVNFDILEWWKLNATEYPILSCSRGRS